MICCKSIVFLDRLLSCGAAVERLTKPFSIRTNAVARQRWILGQLVKYCIDLYEKCVSVTELDTLALFGIGLFRIALSSRRRVSSSIYSGHSKLFRCLCTCFSTS